MTFGACLPLRPTPGVRTGPGRNRSSAARAAARAAPAVSERSPRGPLELAAMGDWGADVPDHSELPELSYGRADPKRMVFGPWGKLNADLRCVLQTVEDGAQIGVTLLVLS
eukprot:5191029-Pyramimonas_sp.AAC.1